MRFLSAAWLIIATVFVAPSNSLLGNDPAVMGDEGVLDEEIQGYIQDLGHRSYAVRQRARYELTRLGLVAMDAIRAAEESTDTEIAFAARYLMSSLKVNWSEETDSPEVREILKGYDELSHEDRLSCMHRLANLSNHDGIVALTRLARYEQSMWLSRKAALLALRVQPGIARPSAEAIAKMRSTLGTSDRPSVQWIAQFCEDVEQERFHVDRWRQLLEEERRRIEYSTSKYETDPTLLIDLYRACAAQSLQYGNREQALQLALDSLDKIVSRRQDLLDAVSWCLSVGLSEAVLQLEQREPNRFAAEAELMYGVAEAHLQQGNSEASEASRIAALNIGELPKIDSPEAEALRPDEIERLAIRHGEIAKVLQLRGLFDWAEGEYRHVIERMPIDAMRAAQNRHELADMLDTLERHADIVALLEPLVDRLRKDRVFRNRFQNTFQVSVDRLASQMEYHRGLSQSGQAARSALRKALTYSRDNADVLIAMHDQEGPEEWREYVQREIDRAATGYLRDITRLEENAKRGTTSQSQRLAYSCNQYAWLVGNTEGDLATAIRLSHRSLDIEPDNPYYLDTLARCYFSNGQVDRAVEYQQRAVMLDPHMPPLVKQLKEFRAAQGEDDEQLGNGPAGE